MAARFAPGAGFLVALGLVGCGDDALDAARERWGAAGVVDYDFRYQTSGFVPHLDHRISVRAAQVTAAVDLAGGGAVPLIDLSAEPTVVSLFDTIERRGDGATVTYDPGDGHPVTAWFSSGEEGDGFTIPELTRVP